MNHLKSQDLQTFEVERILLILRSIIFETEKKGTGDVQPHNAFLKGESLDRIIIMNSTKQNRPSFIVKVLTSATVWEFVDKVSRMIDLAPQYCEFKLQSGKKISETDYGKTLGELGFKNSQIVTVTKLEIEDIPNVNLIDPETKKLVKKAYDIFNEWYDRYSDPNGQMTPQSATRFILGATNEVVVAEDKRIKDLFDAWDKNKDGVIERHEFLQFYEEASQGK